MLSLWFINWFSAWLCSCIFACGVFNKNDHMSNLNRDYLLLSHTKYLKHCLMLFFKFKLSSMVCDDCIAHLPLCRSPLWREKPPRSDVHFWSLGAQFACVAPSQRNPRKSKAPNSTPRSLTRFLWHLVCLYIIALLYALRFSACVRKRLLCGAH